MFCTLKCVPILLSVYCRKKHFDKTTTFFSFWREPGAALHDWKGVLLRFWGFTYQALKVYFSLFHWGMHLKLLGSPDWGIYTKVVNTIPYRPVHTGLMRKRCHDPTLPSQFQYRTLSVSTGDFGEYRV